MRIPQDLSRNGLLNGESNFGRYTMRLCDFMVDHVGEWDLLVCNGDSLDQNFKKRKDQYGNDTQSVTSREQQLVFRHRPGGRAVFMASESMSIPFASWPNFDLNLLRPENTSTLLGTKDLGIK